MTVILDAGALVAIERRDRAAMAFVAREQWRLAAEWEPCSLADVIDAALALLAQDGDEILTSDPDDLGTLLAASGTRAAIVTV